MNKKGQIQSLSPAILALVFAAIVLVMGIVILQGVVDTRDASTSTTAANETLSLFVGSVNQSVDAASSCGFGAITPASVVVYNSSGDVIIASGNYSINTAGSIVNLTDTNIVHPWLISYSYTWGGAACQPGEDTISGLGTFADFWEIIVLAIVIMVVIGLLLVVFGGKRPR